MSISRPNKRIIRPFIGSIKDKNIYFIQYARDNYFIAHEYAVDRMSLCNAYSLIESDFKTILEYIEPSDENINTYSHRLYEVYLRAATEFESNCKNILRDNKYTLKKDPKDWNIKDYQQLDKHMELSQYKVKLNNWIGSDDNCKVVMPFCEWNTNSPLQWYHDYNMVKHNRFLHFNKASLINTFTALSGLYAILYAQFGGCLFSQLSILVAASGDDDFEYDKDSILGIKAPLISCWSDEEKYDFSWDAIRDQPNPFEDIKW